MNLKAAISDPRRRVILITVITSIIFLILIVILGIKLASKKPSVVTTETTDVAVTTPVDDKKTDPVDNSNGSAVATVKPAENKKPEAPAKAEDLPKTGPESTLPIALLLGTATAYLASRRSLAKSVL